LGPGPRRMKRVNLLGPGPRLMKRVNVLGPGPRRMKMNLPGRGPTKVEKNWFRRCHGLSTLKTL